MRSQRPALAIIALALIGGMLIFGDRADAALLQFEVQYSGVPLGNTGSATGVITIDDSQLAMPGLTGSGVTPALVTQFDLTVTGAAAGNGSFSLADFYEIYFAFSDVVDMNLELVGQPQPSSTAGLPWGDTAHDIDNVDFNIFAVGDNPLAPMAVSTFTIVTAYGYSGGDHLQLISFAPVVVPEPSTYLMAAFALLGLGFFGRRRKRA